MNKLKNTLIVILTAGLMIAAFYAIKFHGQKEKAEDKTVCNQKTVKQAAKILTDTLMLMKEIMLLQRLTKTHCLMTGIRIERILKVAS